MKPSFAQVRDVQVPERTSPTFNETLMQCELRAAFQVSAERAGGARTSSPWAIIGIATHLVFERVALGIVDGRDRTSFELAWGKALTDLPQLLAVEAKWGRKESWPKYYLRRAQAQRVAGQ